MKITKLIRNILHSACLFHIAVKIVTFRFPRKFNPLDKAVPVQKIKNDTRDIFLNAIVQVSDEIVEISTDCNSASEFAITRKSVIPVVRCLMDSQQVNNSCYLQVFGITFNSKWFGLLKLFSRFAILSRKISFFIAYGNKTNPFFYSHSCGIILHVCRFNTLGNAHIRHENKLPTTIHCSIFKKTQSSSKTAAVRKLIPQLSDVHFPIDLVYTWAGTDLLPSSLNSDDVHSSALSNSRASHIDELRFSLRSLAVNAEFVNKIYIVVKDHPPSWLNMEHPQIIVVTDNELIPNKPDGGVNSLAIESALHHLEGLAEHFIYLNDDFFFLSPCFGSDFFYANGIAKQFVENKFAIPLSHNSNNDELIPADHACWNSRELMRKEFHCYYNMKYKHAPYAMRKQDMIALEELFPEAMKTTSRSGTRSKMDIATTPSLIHLYGFYKGHSVPCHISNLLIHIDSPRLSIQTLKLLRKRSIKTLCINEINLSHPKQNQIYKHSRQLLEYLFPLKCDYEV